MNYKHLRGIVIEGISHAGKTSTLNALKLQHGNNSERSILVLGEHYSQIKHKRNKSIEFSTFDEHMKILNKNLNILISLGRWGNYLGDYKRESRGLFYIFERYHLNHLQHFYKSDISDIEKKLLMCNAKTILLTTSSTELANRVKYRNPNFSQTEVFKRVDEFEKEQNELIELSKRSLIPTEIVNTDEMKWKEYAKLALTSNE